MVDRLLEQQVAILATFTDEAIKKQHVIKSVTAVTLNDHGEIKLCETFLALMQSLYHATLAMTADQKPTVGIIIPLLNFNCFIIKKKMTQLFRQKKAKQFFDNLETCHKDEMTLNFFEETSSLDARFKYVTSEDKLALHGPVRVKMEKDQSKCSYSICTNI
jgi:hypothetical protein